MLDVFEIAGKPVSRPNKKGLWYVINPNAMYPATIKHIEEVIARGTKPDGVLGKYFEDARKIETNAWDYAKLPPEDCPSELVNQRAVALDLSRLWFTEMLHRAIGGGELNIQFIKPEHNPHRLFATREETQEKDRTLLKWLGLRVVRS